MSELRQIYEAIPGGPELLAWFGVVPSFHDAEIMRLNFCRGAAAELCVNTWILTADSDNQGFYLLGKETLVNFILDDVVDLQLDGFTQQNVIDGLLLNLLPGTADKTSADNTSPNEYELTLDHCYGLSGSIRCKKIRIEFTPVNIEDSALLPPAGEGRAERAG